MDRDYEPLGTVQPFMSARFARRGYPRAVVRALKTLEASGLIAGYRLVTTRQKDKFVPQPISLRSRDLWSMNSWFRATPKGIAVWKASGVRAI